MEQSTIFNLMELSVYRKWKKDIEKNDELGFNKKAYKYELKLKETLNEDEKEIFARYNLAIEEANDIILYNLNVKSLNIGIKIGMELQKSLDIFNDN